MCAHAYKNTHLRAYVAKEVHASGCGENIGGGRKRLANERGTERERKCVSACVCLWTLLEAETVLQRDGVHVMVRIRAITRVSGCGPDEPSQWTVSLEATRQYPALRVASIVRYTSRPTHPGLVDENAGHPDRHREDDRMCRLIIYHTSSPLVIPRFFKAK